MKPAEFLNELSNEKLAKYKTAAAADAKKADSEGDYKRGDKRFSGIVKATKKQFANDEKKEVAEAGNNYHANRTGFSRPSNHRDDERHDLDTPAQVWGLKINGKVWSKAGKDVTFTSKEAALNIRNSILKNRPDLEIGLVTKGGSTASGAQSKTDDNFRAYLAQRKAGEEQLDEIIDPSTALAKALRYVGRKFAQTFPLLAVGGVGAGLAATGLMAPIVASMGGISTALSALSAEMAFSAGMAGTYAAPSIIQTIKDLFAADENSIQSGIKRWVEKYVGDDNDVQEFMLVHSKAAYEGKPGFRWRAKEWPVKMTREQAEAYLEKNDKSWIDYEKQKVIDAEKAKAEKAKADKEGNQELDENLHKWFKEKWVRFGPDGKIRGDCARGDDSEGKPKCLPQSKAHSLGKKGRASAASRKRREDPNPERSGKAINVNTKKTNEEQLDELSCWSGYHRVAGTKAGFPGSCAKNKTNESEHSETCPYCGGEMVSEELMNEKKDACYYKVKSRYKVWPSAYASGALVKCRKKGASNWGNGGKKNESVAESEDIRPQGKILKKLHDIAYSSPALTFQNFRQSGKEAIITDAIMACKVLKHHYLQNKNQPTAQIIYNLENELDNFMRGRKLPTPDGNEYTMDLSDLLKGTLGKMRFQQKVDEEQLDEKWTKKYKDSINCSNPKGFSQKAHCAGKQKNESAIMSGLNQLDEGWKEKLGAAALAGSMALGAGAAHSRVTPDGQGGFTGGLKPSATVTTPADNKPAAEAPKGFSKEYLQKAANPDRIGRYMISVEKAQELLKSMP